MDPTHLRRSRRRFVFDALATVPTVALAGYALGGMPKASFAADPGTVTAYTPTYFKPDEWAFIRAFVDRLIPADENGPGALEAGVPEFIDRQMSEPYGYGKIWYMKGPFRQASPFMGYQLDLPPRDLYRRGIPAVAKAIEAAFGKPFGDLDAATRDQAITRLQKGELDTKPVPAATFFGQLLQNTREGYFTDPVHGGNRGMAAWKMIGFPGARADYYDWVDQYGKAYPFGPVSIKELGA